MSLVLTRKENEAVYIDKHIKVTVLKMEHGTVKLAFDAPRHIKILREELELHPKLPPAYEF